ncbi:hypothetical protein QBC35DRAFT_465080 [Podospora australis]|uniref:Uncharacterized protein n=1 Tax=Podospora australis TaxID=1536484 RepID=A0AAN6WT77_9PEZI|nr:hypothetical protein QBC35DRAFT_465080 [Podospora australis]
MAAELEAPIPTYPSSPPSSADSVPASPVSIEEADIQDADPSTDQPGYGQLLSPSSTLYVVPGAHHGGRSSVESSTGLKQSTIHTTAKRVPVWRQWLMELLLCLCSVSSFVVILVVLATYDDRELPSLPLHITLNTFLAFFTTFAKATLIMIPISEAMSQWKWNLFVSKNQGELGRPVSDLQVLNAASRGTCGSLKLLVSFRLGSFRERCSSPLHTQYFHVAYHPTDDCLPIQNGCRCNRRSKCPTYQIPSIRKWQVFLDGSIFRPKPWDIRQPVQ